jgi:hypothetical protein
MILLLIAPCNFLQESACVLLARGGSKVYPDLVHTHKSYVVVPAAAAASGNCIHVFGDEHRG